MVNLKVRVFLSCALIATGLSIMFYPHIKAVYFEQRMNSITQHWLDSMPEYSEEWATALYFDEGSDAYDGYDDSFPTESVDGIPSVHNNELERVEGILYIDAIGLQSPIMSGANKKNLNLAVCRVDNTSGAGEYGNYCLAGHRSRIYGRHFNRLAEVSIDDIITVHTRNENYSYVVSETFTVKDDDLWVLESDTTIREVTLITCDYNQEPVGRLIVKGVIVE